MRHLSRLQVQRTKTAWSMLALTVLALVLVAGFPLLKTIHYSFTNARLDDLANAQWIGLENYRTLLSDHLWWKAVGITFEFAFFSVSLETILGLMIALALSREFRGRAWIRALVLVPWAIPTVVSTRIWEWMYNDQYGIINEVLVKLHVLDHPIAFLASPEWQMPSMVMVDIWKTTPFMVLLIMAGLTTIPNEVTEAARVDGANRWQIFFKVTLPLLKPTLLVALTFRILDALRVFDIVFVLFGTNENTATMSVYARAQMIEFQETGVGSAASVMIFLLIGGFILLQTLLMQRSRTE